MVDHWAAAWSASAQGPYPHGRETAQPDLSALFPEPGFAAHDQSFRMIVRPDIWGTQARIRLSNAHGSKPVTFSNLHMGLQMMSSALLPGTNQPIKFGDADDITIVPGTWAVSDPINLDFLTDLPSAFMSLVIAAP